MTPDTFRAHRDGEVQPVPNLDDTTEFAVILTLEEYQRLALATSVYPWQGQASGLSYATLGLAGEAGEIANQVKKVLRDDDGKLTPARRFKIRDEMGDVLWYLSALGKEAGVTLEEAARNNLEKLAARRKLGTLQGDKREEAK
jgi:NTP pyrophosphatase (non-canonical NTP hydrolase)